MPSLSLTAIRRAAQRHAQAVNAEAYRHYAGLKEELNLTAIFRRYEHLFRPATIRRVQQARRRITGDAQTRLLFLERYLVDNDLQNLVREMTDALATEEARTTLRVNGEELPYHQAYPRFANEAQRDRRTAIYRAYSDAADGMNSERRTRWQRLHTASQALGYANYTALFDQLKDLRLRALVRVAQRFLAATGAAWERRMNALLEETAGVGLREAESHDVTFVFRGHVYDPYFPKGGALAAFQATMTAMGIQLDAQRGLHIDVEERPKKMPRAFCAPVRIPQEIYLVTKPIGGAYDFEAFFHEGGHAEHFAHLPPQVPLEYRYFVSNSIAEIFSFLFEHITHEPAWLRQHTQLPDVAAFVSFRRLAQLRILRSLCGSLLYETGLHRDGLGTARQRFQRILGDAMQYRIHPAWYLHVDDGFYAAEYLLASLFQAHLHQHLVEEYGETWFGQPRVAGFLRQLWVDASRQDIGNMGEKLGFNLLNTDPLIAAVSATDS